MLFEGETKRQQRRNKSFEVSLGDGLIGRWLSRWATAARKKLADAGWRIRLMPTDKIEPIDVRERTDHPASLLYYGQQTAQSVLIELPVERGYSMEAFPLVADGPHPFIRAVCEADRCADGRRAIREVLSEYYRTVRPGSAAEWLGLSDRDLGRLQEVCCADRLLPWDAETLEGRRRGVRGLVQQENQHQGKPLSIDDGWKLCGPVSQSLIESQTDRLYTLYRSVKNHGFERHDELDGDIRAMILIDESGDWTWLQSGGGFHRVAVASALGYRSIPVRVWRLVFRRHVDSWPQVVRGHFCAESALDIFDRMFDRKPLPATQNWCRKAQAMIEDKPSRVGGKRLVSSDRK